MRGTFLPTKHVLPAMIAQRYGKIVNISGTLGAARLQVPGRLLRRRSGRCAGSRARSRSRSGPYNINVNALHPGIVAGERMDQLCREKAKKRGWTPEQVYDEYVDEMALRRVTTQETSPTRCSSWSPTTRRT